MTSVNFCYWLQGFFELDIGATGELTEAQVGLIKKHLALVFLHDIDPAQGNAAHRAALQAIHDGKPVARGEEVGPG